MFSVIPKFKKIVSKLAGSTDIPAVAGHSNHIFNLFWKGMYQEVCEYCNNYAALDWKEGDYVFIFACHKLANKSVGNICDNIRSPFTKTELSEYIRDISACEQEKNKCGLLTQPESMNKALFAGFLGGAARKSNFIETGTYIGYSTYLVSGLFENVITVEADKDLHFAANSLFAEKRAGNIKAYLGDSKEVLKNIDSQFGNDSVFFLDAHYSTGPTSNKYGACPLIEELRIIQSKSPEALIVVDDIRYMTGKRGYPTLQQIFAEIPTTHKAEIAFDQMIISKNTLCNLPIIL